MTFKSYIYAAVALLFAALVAGLYYYKSEVAKKETEIVSLQSALSKEEEANTALTKRLENVTNQVNTYVEQLSKMSEDNSKLTSELQRAQAKLASHNLLKLRNSRHSEMVLKTINKSVNKSHEEWANE